MPVILLVVGAVIVVGALALAFLPSNNNQVVDNTPDAIVETPTNTLPTSDSDSAVGTDSNTASDATNDPVPSDSTYQDGTYTTDVTYQVPSGQFEPVKVTMTLDNDIITDVELEFEGIVGTSRLNQAKFVNAYEPLVIGKDIDSLNLSRVGGASLTTKAFNSALVNIKADAA